MKSRDELQLRADLQQDAVTLITRQDPLVFDVADHHGQIFDNVKHMSWFREAVVDWLDNTRCHGCRNGCVTPDDCDDFG